MISFWFPTREFRAVVLKIKHWFKTLKVSFGSICNILVNTCAFSRGAVVDPWSEVRPHDRRSLTSTLMSIIDHQSRNSIAIVNHRSWIVNFSTIDRRSPIVTFTIDRRSSIVTVKNYYKKQSKKLLNQTCSNCKESDLWDFSSVFLDNYLQK